MMCGFVGIYSKGKTPVRPEWIKRMADSVIHRGPDAEGIKIFGPVALGHRRLQIIDLHGGVQPMKDFKGTNWIVFNGEIYNFRDLRDKLEKSGIEFRTECDTEVLVNTITCEGTKGLSGLNGMFGFAYYRPEDNYCLLARDHLGIKPVYYHEGAEWITFASEIKALLTLPWIKFNVNEAYLEELLTFRFITGRSTLFKDIHQLEPGEYLEISNGKVTRDKFWDLPQEWAFEEDSGHSLETLDSLLTSSIEKQLVADVPLGTFLSGGVDSGIVTAMASLKSGRRLKTFVVGFDSPEFDERRYARQTSERYKTNHHEYVMNADSVVSDIKKLSYYNDEPISHPNSIPLYHLSGIAKESVKVVLTGEGADEMLAGYPRYQIIRIRDKVQFVPTFFRKMVGQLFSNTTHRKIKMLGKGLLYDNDEDALIYNSQFSSPKIVNKILLQEIPREGLTHRRKYATYFRGNNLHQRLMALEIKTYLLSALHRLDRMSMAHGLESRVPFLDYRLVEWIMSLNPNLKVRGKTGKLVLKQLAEKYIAPEIVYRPKSGFGLPLAEWFRDKNVLKPFLSELGCGNYYLKEYFDQKAINMIIKEHLSCRIDHSELLWILFCLHFWYEAFI